MGEGDGEGTVAGFGRILMGNAVRHWRATVKKLACGGKKRARSLRKWRCSKLRQTVYN
jgi:hypothetical protein